MATDAERNRTRRKYWWDYVVSVGGTPAFNDTLVMLMRKAFVALGGTVNCCTQLTQYQLTRRIFEIKACSGTPVVTYWNAEQSYTATCPDGSYGDPVTVTIPAHTYSSLVSQADADAEALGEATSQALAALSCTDIPVANDCFDFPDTLTADPAWIAWANAMRDARHGAGNTPINPVLTRMVPTTFPNCLWMRTWGEPYPISRYGAMTVQQATPGYGYPLGTKFMFTAGTGSTPFSLTYFSDNAGFNPLGTYTWDNSFGYVFPLPPGDPPATITIT